MCMEKHGIFISGSVKFIKGEQGYENVEKMGSYAIDGGISGWMFVKDRYSQRRT